MSILSHLKHHKVPLFLTAGLVALGGWFALPSEAGLGDYNLAQTPLYMGNPEAPLMMIVMSRDEQLFNKAYTDYTDLDDDGTIDTTYNDKFNYAGYFDSKLCYTYSSSLLGGASFTAAAAASGANSHSCSGQWSGNFLNWISMSRLDIVRSVLYGGKRFSDGGSSTVLERAYIPNDLHAWVKVYSGSDIGSFTPLSGTQSFCNASMSTGGAPLMRVAAGRYSEWSSTAANQCQLRAAADNLAKNDVPTAATDYTVRVNVCASSSAALRENFCRSYSNGVSTTYKPAGLLQEYGEAGKIKFGLLTGTNGAPRAGGALRRNIGLFAGNGTLLGLPCASDDEVNLTTGQFCAKVLNQEGIIRTLENLTLDQWSGSTWADCNQYAILNRQGQGGNGNLNNPGTGGYNCSAWGNPLTEMYAEALRYVSGSTATSSFGAGTELAGIPLGIAWKDPYRSVASGGSTYCASCSVLVLSSGLPSFDSDEVPSVPNITDATSATNAVGAAEGIHGKSFFAGRVTATPLGASLNTHSDTCQAYTINSLGLVRGLCPDSPSTEGSFLIAGLAHQAQTKNMRPTLTSGTNAKVTVKTYGVQLAESLPAFKIPLGASSISLSPLCQSNNDGNATATSSGWRTCFLGSVDVGATTSAVTPFHTYGRPLQYSGSQLVAGSYKLTWEDSLWGNDHDNDQVSVVTFCVGGRCNDKTNTANTSTTYDICYRSDSTVCTAARGQPTVAADEVLVRVEVISAYAGNALLTGMTVTGSNANGTYRDYLRPGGKDTSLISSVGNPDGNTSTAAWSKPKVYKFKAGGSDTGLLNTPLWYAAKYGNFTDTNNNGLPDAGEWDTKSAGTPDGYFLAHNPIELKQRLGDIFKNAAGGSATVSGSGSGARINSASFSVYATYTVDSKNNWTGDLVAEGINSDGSTGNVLWKASSKMNSATSRNIIMTQTPTKLKTDGTVLAAATAAPFTMNNLPGATPLAKLASLGIDTIPAWYQTLNSLDSLVNFLLGSSNGQLRPRSNVLGDIVNSSPEIVLGSDDYGYRTWKGNSDTTLDSLGTSYKTYLDNKATRTPMVYIGANDGMLHGFNATNNSSGGSEVLAFVPHSSRQHMAALADPDYSHQYYVDGLLTSGDVYSGSWKTVLVGSTGAGGHAPIGTSSRVPGGSVFGLDVSSPTSFSGSSVLWELNTNDDVDLGYVLGSAKIVPVKIGTTIRFVALFGNGVNSGNGAPALFVVDALTGQVIKRIKPTGTFSRNGLVNIAPIARLNGNGLADTVYGGDMQGNVWRFDLSSASVSDWTVAYNNTPLFTAINADSLNQPITGELEVVSGPSGGQMIYFGTGRYIMGSDITDLTVQSLYGIWDNNATVVGSRANLTAQTITASATASRTSSSNEVSYTGKRGWYIDLKVGSTATGERFVGTPTTQSGNVYFVTYVPTQTGCAGATGINWLYGLSALSGAPVLDQASTNSQNSQLCTANCGAISLTNISGATSPAPIKTSDVFIPSMADKCQDGSCSRDELLQAQQCSFLLSIAGASDIYLPRACGRQSWRRIQ